MREQGLVEQRNFESEISESVVLNEMGVQYFHIEKVDSLDTDEAFAQLKSKMGVTYSDQIVVSPAKFPDNYEEKLKVFFAEHLHADDEIRLILDGRGYFDIRSANDKWVRILVERGDLITLPAGSYHRFTTDETVYLYMLNVLLCRLTNYAFGLLMLLLTYIFRTMFMQ